MSKSPTLPAGTTLPRGLSITDSKRWPLILARELFELKYGKAIIEADLVDCMVALPGSFVGAEDVEDDGEGFEVKMKRLVGDLKVRQEEGKKLDKQIWANLRELGYGE